MQLTSHNQDKSIILAQKHLFFKHDFEYEGFFLRNLENKKIPGPKTQDTSKQCCVSGSGLHGWSPGSGQKTGYVTGSVTLQIKAPDVCL